MPSQSSVRSLVHRPVCILHDMSASKPPARERLLAATAELTYLGGIEATGVDAISRAAGVTKRTLYQHFRSKDDLVAASLQARDAPAIAALRRAALKRAEREACPPVLALFDAIGALLEAPRARGCAFLNASLELGDADRPAGHAARAHLHALRELVGQLLPASHPDPDPPLLDD